jgi:multiple sugar transport system substrate-binding protein
MPSGWPALEIFLGLLRQNGGEPYNAEVSAATFHSDAGVASLMWMVDQVEKGYSPPVVADHWQEFTGPLRRNTIEFNGIWQIGDVGAAGLHYRVAPLPTIGERTAMWANSHQFFMSKAAAKHEHRLHASQVFLDFLSRQSSAWSAAGMIPARNSERGVGMYRTSKQYVLDGYLEEMHFAPSVAGLPSVTRATLGAVVPAVIGERMSARDARAALEKAAADANRLLKDNRRAWGS